MINYDRLRAYAQHLDEVAKKYAARDPEAQSLYEAIKPLLAKAQAGLISERVEPSEFPTRAFFTEGGLRKYRELESAYSEFAVEAMDLTSHLGTVERILAKVRQ